MKRILILLLLHLFAVSLLAGETVIQVGETAITVPAPSGFAPVTKDLTDLNQVLETFVAPDNVRFTSFVPEELLPKIQRGEIPAMPRTLSVQTHKKVVNRTTAASEFKELKATMRQQYAETIKKVEKQLPGFFDKANKSLQGDWNTKIDLNLNGIVPLPPHEESERSMASSMLLNLTVKGDNGQTVNHPGVVTTTFLHVRGKLLFVYVNGGANDLEWSRRVAKDWTSAILAANPPTAATIAKESASNGPGWGQRVLGHALIGAAIGGVIGLVRYLTRRKPRSEEA